MRTLSAKCALFYRNLERVSSRRKIVGLTTNAPNQVLTALSIGAFVAAAVYDIAVYRNGGGHI